MANESAQNKQTEKPQQPSPLEWVTGAVGLVLVLFSLGFTLYQAFTTGDAPPDIILQGGPVREVSGGYHVALRAVNRSDETAAGLLVEGALRRGGREVETSETTFDYLPAHSEREGGLFFGEDPRRGTLELRAKGYQEP